MVKKPIDTTYLQLLLDEAKAYALPGYEFYGLKDALKGDDPRIVAKRLREIARQVLEGVFQQKSPTQAGACACCAKRLWDLASSIEEA